MCPRAIYNRHGFLNPRDSIGFASSSPTNRSGAGSHFNNRPNAYAIFPRWQIVAAFADLRQRTDAARRAGRRVVSLPPKRLDDRVPARQ